MFFTALTTEGFFPFWSKSGAPQDMHKIRAQTVQDRQDHCGRQVELKAESSQEHFWVKSFKTIWKINWDKSFAKSNSVRLAVLFLIKILGKISRKKYLKIRKKCHLGKNNTWGKMSQGKNVTRKKCFIGKNVLGKNVFGKKCQ